MAMEQQGENLVGNGAAGGIVWTNAMSSFVLTYLTQLVASGTKTSTGFKQVHLNRCAKALNENLSVQVSGGQISNHLRKWKRIYGKIEKLKNLSGALWDEDTCTISLGAEHYIGHIKDHRDVANYLNTPIEYYHEMATIFGNSLATGAYAKGASDPLATEVTETEGAPKAIDAEIGSPTNEHLGGDGGTHSVSNVGDSSGTKPPPAKKPRIADDEDLAVMMSKSLAQMAAAFNKAASSDNDIPDGLYEDLMSIPGFKEAHLDHYYAHLCENPTQARAFHKLSLSSKTVWVARYINKYLSDWPHNSPSCGGSIRRGEGMEAQVAMQIVEFRSKVMEEELKRLGLKVNHHEENIRILKSEINAIDEACVGLGIKLGNYHSSVAAVANSDTSAQEAEQRTIRSVLNQDKTAAAIICQLKDRHYELASKMPLMKDILGFVATLGKVNDDNLSRLLTEYLGMDNMLALVCKTYDGVKDLEKYDKDGNIDKSSGVHGLGHSVGKFLDGRFIVFCLEHMRPYSGNVNIDDPQRKLILHRPRLPGGESPPGFLDFAVNMIHLDRAHLSILTANGHGLRETLFYSLFSHLQVYKTRADIQRALPLINDGAVSLDGGMLRSNGSFLLGDSKNLEVKFPVSLEVSSLPENIVEIEEQVKLKNWERERLLEDMKREEDLLKQVKELYSKKKQELMDFLTQPAVTQTSS